MKVVKMHCGSAHVRGKAKNYKYLVCSLFESKTTKDNRLIWINTGISTQPRRGNLVCIEDGKELAEQKKAKFIDGYGSLHNKEIKINWA